MEEQIVSLFNKYGLEYDLSFNGLMVNFEVWCENVFTSLVRLFITIGSSCDCTYNWGTTSTIDILYIVFEDDGKHYGIYLVDQQNPFEYKK